MQRVGYDADSRTYTYRDEQGSFWEGEPGARYGVLRPSMYLSLISTNSQLIMTQAVQAINL